MTEQTIHSQVEGDLIMEQETREDETMMEEEQLYQENNSHMEDSSNIDDGESSVIAPPIHQVSDESRQQQESPVLLSARCDSMYEDEEPSESMYNNLRSPEEERRTSPVSTNFLRSETHLPSTMPPSFPPFLSDAVMIQASSLIPSPLNSGKRDKPTLLRSLAWSQDSQEERRISKRRKEEPVVASPTTTSLGPHRRSNSSSPTMVHWEEKIEVVELSDMLHKAIQRGTTTSH